MQASVSSGYLRLLCEVATQVHGLAPTRLRGVHGCDAATLEDPGALVPAGRFFALLRFVLAQTGDRGVGLRLAHALDLRHQGFWGYALLSANSVRERVALHARYQRLRGLVSLTTSVHGGMLSVACTTEALPSDLAPIVLDFGFAGACLQHRQRLTRADTQLQLWLSYREEPHHRALRALVGGPVVFEAPCNRLQLPAGDLELPLSGDPHLGKLVTAQLDARLDTLTAAEGDFTQQVRDRMRGRLGHDLSLEAVAADLGVSPRTLRRHLAARGSSFQALLEEERRARAAAYLAETDEEVAWIAAQLGYADPSNFRRAFKRWTGQAPSVFRGSRRSAPSRSPARTDLPRVDTAGVRELVLAPVAREQDGRRPGAPLQAATRPGMARRTS